MCKNSESSSGSAITCDDDESNPNPNLLWFGSKPNLQGWLTRTSPPFSYFIHPLSHLPKPVTTPISDAILRSTPPAPFIVLRLHSVSTLRLCSGGTTIRSWLVLLSKKSLRGGRGEPCHRRFVACCSDLVSLETPSLRSLTWNRWEWAKVFSLSLIWV